MRPQVGQAFSLRSHAGWKACPTALLTAAGCLALALLLSGCADELGAARAEEPAAAPGTSAASTTTPGGLTLAAEQPLPSWLSEAVRLFDQVSGTSVTLPSQPGEDAAAPASAESAAPGGDVRWLEAAEARELGAAGELAFLPSDLAGALAAQATANSYAAFESQGRHWGVPLAASWFGLVVDPERLPGGEWGSPLLLEDWLAELRRVKGAAPAGGGPAAAPLWVAWDEPGCADTFALFVAALGGRLLNDRGLPAFADEGDAGAGALKLMQLLMTEGLIPKGALETRGADLPAALERGHAFWIGWSEALEAAPEEEGRAAFQRRLSRLRPSAFPVAGETYSYETRRAVLPVRYRGLAVSAATAGGEGAWRLARFVSHPLLLNSSGQLTTVVKTAAPPSGRFAAGSRALLASGRQIVAWELTPEKRRVLGRFIQAALKKTLTPEEALTRAARALGAPEPPPITPGPGIPSPETPAGPETQPGPVEGETAPPSAGPGGSDTPVGSPPAPGAPGAGTPPAGTPPAPPAGAEPASPPRGVMPGQAQGSGGRPEGTTPYLPDRSGH